MVYLAYQGGTRIVVDGVESKQYDYVHGEAVFAGPNSVLAWAMRGHQLLRVELQILDNSASTPK